jgi:hypothetical protein
MDAHDAYGSAPLSVPPSQTRVSDGQTKLDGELTTG